MELYIITEVELTAEPDVSNQLGVPVVKNSIAYDHEDALSTVASCVHTFFNENGVDCTEEESLMFVFDGTDIDFEDGATANYAGNDAWLVCVDDTRFLYKVESFVGEFRKILPISIKSM